MTRWMIGVLLLGAIGCDAAQVESAARSLGASLADMTMQEVGDLASRISDDPAIADSMLAANGVELSQLDSVLEQFRSEAEEVGTSLAGMTLREVGELASRVSDDSAVADSIVEATGAEAEGLDSLIVEWRSDARALSELMEKLGR